MMIAELRSIPRRAISAIFLMLLWAIWPATPAVAGIGPENLIVVVNADSADSRTIANHYVELRKIPTRNVIMLGDVPEEQVTTLVDFRDRILKPLLAEIDARGLAPQVRAVAYSCGFPYAVRIDEHRKRLENEAATKIFTPVASINGLTFFYRFVVADREEYLNPASNLYCRMPWERHFVNPFSGEAGERFKEAEAAADEGRDADAAEIYSELFAAQPTQAPLAILAAKAHSRAGDLDAAMRQLTAAAEALWSSGARLAEDADLRPLKDREDFARLVDQLGDAPTLTQHPIGFDASRGWTANGWWLRPDRGGITYLPAFMLAVTRGGGTTAEQAVDYLERAVGADHSYPGGTVYLSATGDVRTKTRKPNFAETLLYLHWLDRRGRVITSHLPEAADDIIGVTLGRANLDWSSSGNTFLPGALADNLTSTGGVMSTPGGQTKLTELLLAGAAAASGTVTEPYALQFKFPLPQMHAYYAAGVTAIEAFYLSVGNPYQLLLVGDPLCQPFARPPAQVVATRMDTVDGVSAVSIQMRSERAGGETEADASLETDRHTPLSAMEFYIEGKLVQRTEPLESYRIKLEGLAGGAYELRTVLVGEPRLAPRKTILTWIRPAGLLPTPTARVVSDGNGAESETGMLSVDLEAAGADSIRLMHFGEQVASIEADRGRVEIATDRLGDGPLRFRPVANVRGADVPGQEFVVSR